MTFADLLERLGGMGRFQVATVALLVLPVLMLPSHNLLQNFTAAGVAHRCRLSWEHGDNDTGSGGDNDNRSDAAALLRAWLPPGERCRRFLSPQWWLLEANGSVANGSWPRSEPCRDGWRYERSGFRSTIVTEWDLVCGRQGLVQVAQSLYMAGVLLGGLLFGGLSDRFGRRRVLSWCHLQLGAMGVASALAPSFPGYCALRLLTGAAFSGVVLSSSALALEWMPPRARALASTTLGYGYTTGQFLLAGVAWALRDWRRLQLAVSLPFLGFCCCSWWLPESARWLLLVGRPRRALQLLQRAARLNGKKEEGDKLDIETLRLHVHKESSPAGPRPSVLDLVRTPVLRRISCCLCFVWFSTSFAYYGLAMDLQNFGFNIYAMQLVFGAVDIPAKLASVLSITFVGRRFTQSLALVLAGLAILANILVPRELRTLRTALAVLGKGCLAASFNCAFLFTGELYPTVIRQTGLGWANTLARVGSLAAPLVRLAGEAAPALPLVVYGAAPVLSGLVAALLPETKDRALPETLQDVEGRPRPHEDEAGTLQEPLGAAGTTGTS